MDGFEKKEIVQAILIADNDNLENFKPFSDEESTALLPLVNVSMIDYALEALNRSGIEEVFVYARYFLQNVKEHIKSGIESLCSWSVNMKVHVLGSESCRCFGDAMRDLDAKALIRGNFILLGADTIMNIDLRSILEEHKKNVKYDKGAAATLIFKEATNYLRTGNEVMIAMDTLNKRLHHHQRLSMHQKERVFEVPLEVFINNSEIALLHNLIDPQIAVGSPTMLSLFSDNFDFETRDHFVRGILINEEILDSRIYVSLLPQQQYARKVNNWLVYKTVSQDIINRWTYPLVPDMGIHCLMQQYIYLKNNIYKSPKASVTKVALGENVVIQAGSRIKAQGTTVSCSVIGSNCDIGAHCRLMHAYIMDCVIIEDGCVLENCVVGSGCVIAANSVLKDGTVLNGKCQLPSNSKLSKALVVDKKPVLDEYDDFEVKQLGENAYQLIVAKEREKSKGINGAAGNMSDDDDDDDDDILARRNSIPKMLSGPQKYEDSDYISSSDDEDSQNRDSTPIPDDINIFLSEVMDSLARGFQEKSNPDFLVLEINSSRYAYNMSLKEVNFHVVKALFSLEQIREPKNNNVLVAINNVLKHLGPVVANYIKTEDAMLDCLKALEDVCDENPHVKDKISQVVHYLYDKDFVSEDAILAWYAQIDKDEERGQSLKNSLSKLIEWLNQSSDDEDDDD